MFRILELVVVASVASLSVFGSYKLMVQEYSLHYRHVGMFGLIWPVVLLAYCWLAVLREKQYQPN